LPKGFATGHAPTAISETIVSVHQPTGNRKPPFLSVHPCHGYFSVIPLLFFPLILLSVFSFFHTRFMGEYTDYVKNMKEACAFASISVVPLLVDADAARRSTAGILEGPLQKISSSSCPIGRNDDV
jgi:hypothetical protein